MKKRLRKRKYLGEFTQYAFEIQIEFQANSDAEFISWSDHFIQCVEELGFKIGGGFSRGKGGGVVSVAPIRCPFSRRWKYINTSEQDRIRFNFEIQKLVKFTSYVSTPLININK